MTTVDRLIAHMQAGRPLTALSARQTYGVLDIAHAVYIIRARGHHVEQSRVTTINKYSGQPVTTVEYRMGGDCT